MGQDRVLTQGSGWAVVPALLLILLPVLYVLGVGPMVWLRDHHYVSDTVVNALYLWLERSVSHSEWAYYYWDKYLSIWRS